MNYQLPILLCCLGFTLFSCGQTDERAAKPTYSKYEGVYDFFNAIRYEVAELEPTSPYLTNFTTDTKKFLQNKAAQGTYQLAGLYYENGLNREKGAYDYADRFSAQGCVIHVVILPPEAEERWKAQLGVNKGKGKQVGNNFLYYQVFTAQPTDEALEDKVLNIIENKISEFAGELGQPI